MLSEREAGLPCGTLAESATGARREEAASEHLLVRREPHISVAASQA